MTYEEYVANRQREYNALPIFYAFGHEQFEKAMNERGLTANDTDKIYKLGNTGGFYLRKDADVVKNFFRKRDILPALMKDHDFAVDAFYYELGNHEYCYNHYQGDWDVCSCFGNCEWDEDKTYKDYLKELGYGDDAIKAYSEAIKKYYKWCDENDLW